MDVEETMVPKKRRSLRLSKKDRKKMSNYFTEYCDATSIHGFRYLGEQKRSCWEKLWWLITITTSVICCAILIIQTYNKWERSPVIVSFATKQTPIWQVPFPAVTICPQTKSRQSVFNFTALYLKKFEDLTDEERKQFTYSSLVCKPRHALKYMNATTVDDGIMEFYDKIAPTFENVSLKCSWLGQKIECSSIFTPIMTDEGVCYTFNMLDREELFHDDMLFFKHYQNHERTSEDWSLKDGYILEAKQNTYPRRALSSGAKNGLHITMVAYEKDLDYICGDSLQGYKVLLHHPAEIPRVSQRYFQLPLNQAVVAAIKPEMMTTSPALTSYSSFKRQCYFPNERKLRFFKTYTQQNCEIECLSNFTLQLCKCVNFHMPRAEGTTLCGPARRSCMERAESLLLSKEIDSKLKEMEDEANKTASDILNLNFVKPTTEDAHDFLQNFNPFNKKKKMEKPKRTECDCLQSCTSLEYNTETSQSDWNWVQQMTDLNDPYDFLAVNHVDGISKAYLSKLVLFFKDMQFITSDRDELYGYRDFVANCGGLLGLFTGFSVISLVEIIYFVSFRWICNIRKYGAKHWSGADKN